MSYNLRNKQYCIRNKQYSKEEYFKELEKFNLKSRIERQKLLKEFEEIKVKAIYRFANITKCVDVTGNNMLNVKNSKNCFEFYDSEDCKDCYRAFGLKDCRDFNYGGNSELLYEYTTGSEKDYNVKFSCRANNSVRDADYTESCQNCNNIFACISLRNKENAIFNQSYSKEEFAKLREKIIKEMSSNPYFDKAGRKYEYGEFFPIEMSPWAYNETPAQEFFPLTKGEAEKNGYVWRDTEKRNFEITMSTDKIPDNIDDVSEAILKEVLSCAHSGKCSEQCTEAFRITDYELKFYKKHNIPLPIFCPNCRYYTRLAVMPGLKLYKRVCMKCNKIEFETAYAPDRPEKIYCESCYNKEVY